MALDSSNAIVTVIVRDNAVIRGNEAATSGGGIYFRWRRHGVPARRVLRSRRCGRQPLCTVGGGTAYVPSPIL